MDHGTISHQWHDLYVMLGGASAALLGLLFVATSLHLREIANNQGYRIRARNVTIHLVVTLIVTAAVLTPQPIAMAGAGVLVLSAGGLWLPLGFMYKAYIKDKVLAKRGGVSIYRALSYTTSYLLGVVGGLALIKGFDWAMYPVTLGCVNFLASATLDAWKIMMGVGESAKTKAAN